MSLSKSQRAKVERAIENHDYHKRCYFWKPFGNSSARRRTEDQRSFEVQFVTGGVRYRYVSSVTCSCQNYYCSGDFYRDDKKVTVRTWRKLLNQQGR